MVIGLAAKFDQTREDGGGSRTTHVRLNSRCSVPPQFPNLTEACFEAKEEKGEAV